MIKSFDNKLVINKCENDVTIWHPVNTENNLSIEVLNNCQAKVIYIMDSICDSNLCINVKDGSRLDLVVLGSYNGKEKITKTIETYIEKNAYLNSKKLYAFLGDVALTSKTNIIGKNGSNDDYHFIIGTNQNKQEYYFEVKHLTNETKSTLKNYAVCKNASKIAIDTNGIIKNGSKDSNLSQKTKGILLSKESMISANPWLQIDEYDCLASHGAGIGAIDEEDLFYLMSRGLSRIESERLLIAGFVNPILEELNECENEKRFALKLLELL